MSVNLAHDIIENAISKNISVSECIKKLKDTQVSYATALKELSAFYDYLNRKSINALKPTRKSIHDLEGDKYYAESGSDLSDSEDSTHKLFGAITSKNKIYKRLSYHDVENSINKYYFDENQRHSSSLDILASYLKGQKMIYMEAKYYSEQQLNKLL